MAKKTFKVPKRADIRSFRKGATTTKKVNRSMGSYQGGIRF